MVRRLLSPSRVLAAIAVAAACLERPLGRAGQRHADAIDHGLPKAADPDILLGDVPLVLEAQPCAAA